MELSEFNELTGCNLSENQYAHFEAIYMQMSCDKKTFCAVAKPLAQTYEVDVRGRISALKRRAQELEQKIGAVGAELFALKQDMRETEQILEDLR